MTPDEITTLKRDLSEAASSLQTRARAIAALVDQQRYAEIEHGRALPAIRDDLQVIWLNAHTLRNIP